MGPAPRRLNQSPTLIKSSFPVGKDSPYLGHFIIIVAIICAALAAFTFVVLPFLRHGHGHGHGHDTDEASDDEDDYVEDVAPPYEEIPLIVIQAPDPSYSPTGRCRVDGDNATSGALKSPPYERVIPIQTRSREHPTPTSVSWPTPVHNDDDDDSSSSEQSLSDFDYDSFPAPPPPVFVPLDPSHPPALMPRQEIGSLELRFPVPGSYNPETKTYQTETQVIRGTDVKVPHLKTLFQRYNQRPGEMRKLQLEEWLIAFSPKRRRVGFSGTKSSNLKVSVRRREELIAGTDEAGTLLPSRAPTDRSRDNRTAQEVENLIPWVAHLHARRIVQDYPYKTKAERNPHPTPEPQSSLSQVSHFLVRLPVARIGFDAFFWVLPLRTASDLTSDASPAIRSPHEKNYGHVKWDPAVPVPVPATVTFRADRCGRPSCVRRAAFAQCPTSLDTGGVASGPFLSRGSPSAEPFLAVDAMRFGNELGVLDVLDSLGLVVRRLVERLFRIFRVRLIFRRVHPRLVSSGCSSMASSPKFHNPAFSMMGHTRLPLAVSTNSVLGCSQPMAVPSTRSTPAAVMLRLKLGTQEITYSVDEIPDPPVLKFCIGNPRANVLALATMWTDEPGWPWHTNPDADNQRKRLPTVNGHPIPLKYWPTLYKNVTGSKNQIWAKTKAHWSDWRFLMDYWEHSQNDETFWGMLQYPDRITGQLVDPSINEIHKALREARKSRDSEDFKRARLEYSEADFGRFFNRRGTAVTLTREDHVGARYREFITQKARKAYGEAEFAELFVYDGRFGRTRMLAAEDIASKFQQLQTE
ncbi:hypothetical protein B0H14DRAFT_2599204 [Mycena olivaceomarginata]|nr:hypothetical protein B0H14DRAFT_2599204 [Mycena olivaceomarginata]